MHAQELAHIIATKRDEVRDLLALRLGDAQPLTGLDLEADVSTRNHRDRHPRLQDRARTTQLNSHSSSHSIRVATAGVTPQVRGLAIRSLSSKARPDHLLKGLDLSLRQLVAAIEIMRREQEYIIDT